MARVKPIVDRDDGAPEHRADAAVSAQLLEAHGPRWLVELTVWVGRYQALAGILNGFEVTPTSPTDVLPAVPRPPATQSKVRAPLPTPRVEPVTRRDQLAETDRAVFDAVTEGRGSVRGPFGMLLHSPVLCRRHLDVGTYLRF